MSEDRFRIRTRYDKDYSEDETRRGLWLSTMAGGVANIWGNLTRPDGEQVSGQSLPYPHPEWIRTYSDFFFTHGRFAAMAERATGITDGVALRSADGQALIVYVEDVDSTEIDLSGLADASPAVAVDALAAYEETDLGSLAPEEQTVELPGASDWAIAIGDFGAGVDGDSDADVDADVDGDNDADADGDADGDIDADTDGDVDGDPQADGGDGGDGCDCRAAVSTTGDTRRVGVVPLLGPTWVRRP
jgi:hypothetical protein